jgi:aryl-alcohol dehydrogenase-like predicted oxidoreductase
MRYTVMGRTGLRVSGLCLGTMTFDGDGQGWCVSRDEGRRIVDAFLDAGGNFIDTHTYGPTEDYLGTYLEGRRDEVVLATKYGGTLQATDVNSSGGHRKSLIRSVETSLRRLRTDYLDLLWLHAWTVARAVTLAETRGWSGFSAVQVEYSLVERDVDREIVPMARELGLTVAAWTPLASGWLTGKYLTEEDTDGAARARRLDDPVMTRFLPRTERTLAIAEEVRRIAGENGCPSAHVALNWLRRRGAVPIFGATSPEQVLENAACFGSDLTDEQMDRLNKVSRIRLGFPHDFLASGLVRRLMYGSRGDLIDAVAR